MTPEDWERHMSWRRHCIEPRVFFRVFKTLSMTELWVLFMSTFAALYATFLQPRGWPVLCAASYSILFQLTSFALALLMVFRTNTAHMRWWEARTAIGRWLSVVRNCQRMLVTWAPPEEAHLVREFARWNAALTTAGAAYLNRNDELYQEYCDDLLSPDEIAWLSEADNPPVVVMMMMSGILKRWAGARGC